MTTCSYCLDNMAARSREQLENRKRNASDHPHIMPGPCPSCGGTEWMLTDAMIPAVEKEVDQNPHGNHGSHYRGKL